jgi:hypothetical protein
MSIYKFDKSMMWKLDNIRFLYPPDNFNGTFANAMMQERHKAQQDQKIKAIVDQLKGSANPLEAMQTLHPLDQMQFLHNNRDTFREGGYLEKAVLQLYFRKNTPFAAVGDYEEWKLLLNWCDSARLYEQGQPFPFAATTAYRGSITGIPKGLCWTVSREEAAWILERWQDKSLGGGTVFALEITRQDILLYREEGKRREVLLRPEIAETAAIRAIDHL